MTLSLVERVVSGIPTNDDGKGASKMDEGRRNTAGPGVGRDLKPIAIALLLALVLFAAFVAGYAAETQATHHLLGAR